MRAAGAGQLSTVLEKFEFSRALAMMDSLTAAEGQRTFPSRKFRFSHLLAGPLSTHLDYAPNGPAHD